MRKIAKINPFFIEMIFVMLIMTVCCFIFINIFASVESESHLSRDKNNAMINAQAQIEQIFSCKDTKSVDNTIKKTENFNSDWKEDDSSPNFQMITDIKEIPSENGVTAEIKIKVFRLCKSNDCLYEVTTKKYFAEA